MKLRHVFSVTLAILLILNGLLFGQAMDSAKAAAHMNMMGAHPGSDAKPPDSSKIRSFMSDGTDTLFAPEDFIVVETHHQLYPDFLQIDTVKFHQRFQLGEENIYAEAFRFVPDLKITMKGEKIKTSDTLYNPAVQLRVFVVDTTTQKDSLVQESWAFSVGGSPHFSRHSFFAFSLKNYQVANPKYIKPTEGK